MLTVTDWKPSFIVAVYLTIMPRKQQRRYLQLMSTFVRNMIASHSARVPYFPDVSANVTHIYRKLTPLKQEGLKESNSAQA